jgi:polysaccharide pyruvyl transferase WcaK-like protein
VGAANEMPKVAIVGWYGHNNFGDDLILQGLKRLFAGWQVEVASNDEPEPSSYGSVDFKKINDCDLFVLGGGELIQRSCLLSNMVVASRVKAAYDRLLFSRDSWIYKVKIPKIILGCGVNAEFASELTSYNVKALEQFKYIGVRDTYSLNLLRNISSLRNKVNLFYDTSLALEPPQNIRTLMFDTAVVIPTDRMVPGDYGARRNIAVNSERWLKERLRGYRKAIFLAFGKQDNDDYKTCEALSHLVDNSEIIPYEHLTFKNVAALLVDASIVVPYRLHSLILSYMVGAQYDYYPYHWKLNRVQETLFGKRVGDVREIQKLELMKVLDKLSLDESWPDSWWDNN